MNPCLIDIAEVTGGHLRLAAMPPIAGELAQIGRIVLSPQLAGPRDVFWQLAGRSAELQMAYFHGALGVVSAVGGIEPWPGRFSLQVDDAATALLKFLEAVAQSAEKSLAGVPELKVLQLCAARPFSISPPTCGRSAKGPWPNRCRRQAA